MNKIVPIMWLMLAAVIIGASIGFAARANADGVWDSFEMNYADDYAATAICGFLDDTPTVGGVVAMTVAVSDDSGFDMDSAVDVMNYSAWTYCPRHWALLVAVGDAARAAAQPQLKYAI